MAMPEFEPQQPQVPEQINQRAEQAEIPQDVEQGLGTQTVPANAQVLTDPVTNQVLVQPVPAPPEPTGPSITIPEVYSSEEQIEQYTHGNATESVTWQTTSLMRQIHIAVRHGWRVIFGNNQQQ